MSYTISHQTGSYQHREAVRRTSVITRFFQWAESEDKINHVAWVGISVTLMSAVLFPGTMAAILFNGASFNLIIAAMSAFVFVVVTNLAALPTKYTIPFFFFAALIDVAVVIASFFIR
ncbi:MAG: hypothetical protein JST75_11730 [Bacteroidetes bacterium]|nr:hypothetical protein [Bacteroidota bacterium]